MVTFLRGKNSFLLSSNVNEVIRAISNLFIFFLRKYFTHIKSTKSTKCTWANKNKKAAFHALKKHLRRKKSLIRLFAVLCFLWFLCFLCFFCFLCVWNLFVKKKKKKEFKTALITSFTILLSTVPFANLLSEKSTRFIIFERRFLNLLKSSFVGFETFLISGEPTFSGKPQQFNSLFFLPK